MVSVEYYLQLLQFNEDSSTIFIKELTLACDNYCILELIFMDISGQLGIEIFSTALKMFSIA